MVRYRVAAALAASACAVLFAVTSPAPAQPKTAEKKTDEAPEGTTVVVADGVGKDEKEARKAAFRSAVSQVVGTLVDAETLVKNDEVISDRILEYSGGFIKTFEVQKTEKTADGLIRVRLKATVERIQIVTKLTDAKIAVKEVRGEDLLAEKLTKEEAKKNATELLAKLFADLPKMVRAEVVGKPKLSPDGDSVVVEVGVGIDQKAYGEFVKKAVPLLDKVATAKDSILLTGEASTAVRNAMEFRAAPAVFSAMIERGPEKGLVDPKGGAPFAFPPGRIDATGRKGFGVALVSSTDSRFEKVRWNLYWVDADVEKCVAPIRGRLLLNLVLADGDDKAITEEEVDLNDLLIGTCGVNWFLYQPFKGDFRVPEAAQDLRSLLVSPFTLQMEAVRLGPGSTIGAPGTYFLNIPTGHKIKLSDKELERLKKIKASVELKPEAPKKGR